MQAKIGRMNEGKGVGSSIPRGRGQQVLCFSEDTGEGTSLLSGLAARRSLVTLNSFNRKMRKDIIWMKTGR